MPRKLLIFQWTGIAPPEARTSSTHIQVPCVAACYSRAEFMRLLDTRERAWAKNYVNVDGREPRANEGARLAWENPGVVYYLDALRHSRRDAEWLVHPDPKRSA